MRKFLSLLFLWGVLFLYTQHKEHVCGFDYQQSRLDRQYPEIRENRKRFEQNLKKKDKVSFFKKIGVKTKAGKYRGKIYEIPVLVHVIESKAEGNKHLLLTDEQIKVWIENCNKMYATTYGNGFYPEGGGADFGTVIPIRLVLAKRAPQCTSTTGIIRYNGSNLANYDQKGVNHINEGGVDQNQIRALARHWPESSYFLIYSDRF